MSDTAGFRRIGSLLVPASLEREREVWTRDDWKAVDRAAKVLKARGVKVVLTCEQCQVNGTLTMAADPTGDLTLSCAHKTRILTRAH